MDVRELKRGQLFQFINVRNGELELYEFIRIEPQNDNAVFNCTVIQIAFKEGGLWRVMTERSKEYCNPYAQVHLVKLNVVPV